LKDAHNTYQGHGESLYIASGKECENIAAVPDALPEGSHCSKWANTWAAVPDALTEENHRSK